MQGRDLRAGVAVQIPSGQGAEDAWGERAAKLEETLARAAPAGRLELLAAAVARRGAEPDGLVVAAGRRLARPGARVAAELGVSQRLLHRRTLAAVGFGPKVLARVARLRRLVALCDPSLSSRALRPGTRARRI